MSDEEEPRNWIREDKRKTYAALLRKWPDEKWDEEPQDSHDLDARVGALLKRLRRSKDPLVAEACVMIEALFIELCTADDIMDEDKQALEDEYWENVELFGSPEEQEKAAKRNMLMS